MQEQLDVAQRFQPRAEAGLRPTDALRDRPDATSVECVEMEHAVRFGDRTIMMHRGMVIADLSGDERRGVTEADLLVRFADLRYTTEMRVTADLAAAASKTPAGA